MKLSQLGWYGVDLDGTLTIYGSWEGPDSFGPPVPAMVERVQRWLAEGREVRIVTARAGERQSDEERSLAIMAVQRWCREHIGRSLPVTDRKDYAMVQLWDDRAVEVEPNTGRPAVVAALQKVKDHLPVEVPEGWSAGRLLSAIWADIDLELQIAEATYG